MIRNVYVPYSTCRSEGAQGSVLLSSLEVITQYAYPTGYGRRGAEALECTKYDKLDVCARERARE